MNLHEWLGALPTLTEAIEMPPAAIVGRYMLARYRKRIAESDVATVARQLRKQGVPFSVARVILLGRI